MADFNTNNNIQSFNFDPTTLIDQLSPIEIYIGVSKNSNVTSKANWRIKKVFMDDTVWKFQFPNGDQSYSFVWDDRAGYTYK